MISPFRIIYASNPQGITLRPDRNRPALRSPLAYNLSQGRIDDSITHIETRGERPRVMLIVPPYTRICRPLDVIMDNLERDENSDEQLSQDRKIVAMLKERGITHLKEMKRAGMPLGLVSIGTAADHCGYDVRILDAVYGGWDNEQHLFTTAEGSEIRRYGLDDEEILRRVREFRPQIVGISCLYTHQWGNARALTDLIKDHFPSTPVILGGGHVSGAPHDALLDSPADYVVIGQAHKTFPELLESITRQGKDLQQIKGIGFKQDGRITITDHRPFMARHEHELMPIPDISLIDLGTYSRQHHSGGRRTTTEGNVLYFETSHGCNSGCNFCLIPRTQGGIIEESMERVERKLAAGEQNGVAEYIIGDDHIMHNPRRLLRLCDILERHRRPIFEEGGIGLFNIIALHEEVGEDHILSSAKNPAIFRETIAAKREGITAEQLIKRMAQAGFDRVYLAVESGNEHSLYTADKPTLNALERYTGEIVGLFSKHGIKTTCGLMLGFINPEKEGVYVEQRAAIERTIAYGKWLRQKGAAYINPFIVTPLPGTPQFHAAKEYLVPNTDEGFSHEFGTMDSPNNEWTRDELNLLRVQTIIETAGIEGYEQILRTGTWPV